MDSPTFVGVSEVEGSFFISCRAGSVYEIASLEANVLSQCIAMEDGSVTVPAHITANIKLKRIFQVKDFNKVSSVLITDQDIVCGNDKQLSFGRDQIKVTFPENFQGVKKIFDLREVM